MKFAIKKKNKAYNLIAIDRSLLSRQDRKIDCKIEPLSMTIQQHYEVIFFDIVSIAKHNAVLGISWLHCHNSKINWRTWVYKFDRCDCVITIQQPEYRQSLTADEKTMKRTI